jgi:hypothetical protein
MAEPKEIFQTTIRVDAKLAAWIKSVSKWYGRFMNDEIELALHAWAYRAALELLQNPEARELPEVQEQLEDPDYETKVRAKLDAVYEDAFNGRSLPDFGEFADAA